MANKIAEMEARISALLQEGQDLQIKYEVAQQEVGELAQCKARAEQRLKNSEKREQELTELVKGLDTDKRRVVEKLDACQNQNDELLEANVNLAKEKSEYLKALEEANERGLGGDTIVPEVPIASTSAPTMASHAAPRSHYPLYKIERPQLYDGSRKMDLKTWLFQVQRFVMLARIPESEQVLHISQLLKGDAATWFRSRVESMTEPANMEEFQNAIMNHFGEVNIETRARDQLYRLEQRGSATEYIAKFTQIALQVSDLSDAEKKHLFMRGLKNAVRESVEMQSPETYDDMLALAEKADRIKWNALRRSQPPSQNQRKSHQGHKSAFRRNHNSSWNRPKQSDFRGEPMEIGMMQRSEVKCFNCNRMGHKAHECRYPKRTQGGKSHSSAIRCTVCNKDGHFASQCRTRLNVLNGEPQVQTQMNVGSEQENL